MKTIKLIILSMLFSSLVFGQEFEWIKGNTGSATGERIVAVIDAGNIGSYDGVSIVGEIVDHNGNWGFTLPTVANFSLYIRFSQTQTYKLEQTNKTNNITLRLRKISPSKYHLIAYSPLAHRGFSIFFRQLEIHSDVVTVTLGSVNTVVSEAGELVISAPTYTTKLEGDFIISAGKDGNARLKIEADTDNNYEADNPIIEFKQDGGLVGAYFGFDNTNFGHNILGIATRHSGNDLWKVLTINTSNGNVGIGTSPQSEKLSVKGTIRTEEVRVEAIGADFVFASDYNLMPLAETEAYIKANHHLPEVPSADEMQANGVELGKMNMLLLQKIEELTLHQIEQNKNIELLLKKVAAQDKEITNLKNKY